jgi:hypothetical protein
MSIENLVDYLSTMGRCGAHFSLHSHITNHSFECRRASKALELMESYIKRGSYHEEIFHEGEFEQIDGAVAWDFATFIVETLNGGLFYGPDGAYMEVPERIFELFVEGFFERTEEANKSYLEAPLRENLTYLLRRCLELRYDWDKAPSIHLGDLYAAGLEDDPPIDYEDY